MPKFQAIKDSRGVSRKLEFRDYLTIFRKRSGIIAIIVSLVILISIFITFTTQPIYSSSSQVLLERNHGKPGLESTYSYYEPDFLETQAEIIRSDNVARKVVNKLGLATKYRHYFSLDDPEDGLVGVISRSIQSFATTISGLVNRESEASDDVNVVDRVAPMSDEEKIAEEIRDGLRVIPVKNTKIVSITFRHPDPVIAKLVVDAVVKAYMDEMLDIKISTSSYSLKWMTEKAAEERDKLEKSERELQKFVRENDLVTVENRLTILPQKLAEFGGQLSKAETQQKELQDLLAQIKTSREAPEELEKISVFATDEVLKNIRERIYKARQNVQELSKKYGRKHPTMIRAQDELKILEEEKKFEIKRIVSTLENSYELAVSKQKSLLGLLTETKAETLDLNEKFVQYQIMKREVDSNRVLYDTLQASIKQQGVTEQTQSVNIWVMKKAAVATDPTKPDIKFNLLAGLILGTISGFGFALVLEHLDNSITTAQQVEERHGLTVLGSIAHLKDKENSLDNYILYNPLSPVAESYRLIRSALLLSSVGKPPRVTLITSMNKSEGKTVTSTNLARMLAQDQKSVLIIDCDLRRPRMHSLLDMSNETGLSGYLAGTIEECPVFTVNDERIDLVPAGQIPPNPSELLGSERMKILIEGLREKYDFIILDSPPIGAVTDSLTLSRFVDGTILVVKAGMTTHDMFFSGIKKMEEIGARILGVVLNGVRVQDHNAYQYGYTTYYAKGDE